MRICKVCEYELKEGERFCPVHGNENIEEIDEGMKLVLDKLQAIEERMQKLEQRTKVEYAPVHYKQREISDKWNSFVELYKDGMSIAAAFDKIGIDKCGNTYKKARNLLKEEGIEYTKRRSKKHTTKKTTKREKLAEVVKLIKKGETLTVAGKKVYGYMTGKLSKKIRNKLKREGIKYGKKRLMKRVSDGKPDGRTIRAKMITNHAKGLVKEFGYTWHRALKMASDWYNANYRKPLGIKKNAPSPVMALPKVLSSENLNKILIDVVKNMIHNQGSINMEADGYTLNAVSKNEWKTFVEQFMLKSNEIAAYIGLENKFKVRIYENGLPIITYAGKV